MFIFGKKAFKSAAIIKPKKFVRTDLDNCLSCANYVGCNNIKKQYAYICKEYDRREDNEDKYLELFNFEQEAEEKELMRETALSIEEMINSAIKEQEAGIQSDFILSDGDIPKAENFVDFYFNPRYKGELTPFPKQIEIAINMLTEYCTNIKCTDVKYAKNIPTAASLDEIYERITLLKNGVCPKCGKTKIDIWNEGGKRADTLSLVAGQRSGKDFEVGFLGAYAHHGYLKLRSPAKAFRMAPGTVLHTTFTGTKFTQAKRATFDPFMTMIRSSGWYNEYHEMLAYAGQKVGRELVEVGKEAIVWPHHGILAAVAAPDVRNLRGVARVFASITELGWFYTKSRDSVRLDPDEIFKALDNSFLNVRSGYRKLVADGMFDVMPPMFVNASSPSSMNDRIMRLLRESVGPTNNIYGVHYSVYQMNPEITPEDLAHIAKSDPVKYKRDYLAIPPNAVKPFIPSKKLIEAAINPKIINAIQYNGSVKISSPSGLKMLTIEPRLRTKKTNLVSPKILGLDAGASFNSFAGTMMHVEGKRNKETGIDEYTTIVDGLFEVIPRAPRQVSFTDVYEGVIIPMIEKYNIVAVVADRWQSKKLLQDIESEMGIDVFEYSLRYGDFLALRQDLFDSKVQLPAMEMPSIDKVFDMANADYPWCFDGKPATHLAFQFLTVEDLMNKTVEKGSGYTDDLFRSLAIAHRFANDEEIRTELLLNNAKQQGSGEELVGAMATYTGTVEQVHSFGGQGGANDIGVRVSYRG